MRVGTFNVRGLDLKADLKLNNLVLDCVNYKLDLLAVQESRNQGPFTDRTNQDGYRSIFYGSDKKYLGLGFVIPPALNRLFTKHWKISDQIAVFENIFFDKPADSFELIF